MKGIVTGYLNSSPFEALTLAIIMQITFRKIRKITIGMPTIIMHKGIARTMYNKIDIWKLSDCFPF
jgi:hypothetical protein